MGSAPVSLFADTSWRLGSVPEAPVLFLVSQARVSTASRDSGVRSAPTCVLRFGVGGEVAAMWRTGIDWDVAVRDLWDVAVRDQAVRAGGGSRGVLILPLYSARWALVSSFSVRAGGVVSVRAGGVEAASRGANRSFTR
jgi:hypothetical protein